MPLYRYSCPNKKCRKSKMIMEYIVPLYLFDEPIKCPKCEEVLVRKLTAPYFKIR